MAIDRFKAPALPIPTKEYDMVYFTQLIRSLAVYFNHIDSRASVTFDAITLTNLPTSGYNLRIGTVYQDNGVLKIVIAGIGYAGSVSATGSVGTVTIVTT
jgi:hypothetical protein